VRSLFLSELQTVFIRKEKKVLAVCVHMLDVFVILDSIFFFILTVCAHML
jgi:hypothetical protein